MKNKEVTTTLRNYNIDKKVNSFLYFLSKAPIFKHFFNIDLVSEYTSKEGIRLAFLTLSYLWILFKKMLYLEYSICSFPDRPITACFLFIILTLIGAYKNRIFTFDLKDYDAIKLLHIDSKTYAKITLKNYLFKEFVSMSLTMIYVRSILNLNYGILFYLVLVYLALHLIGEKIFIMNTTQTNYKVKDKKATTMIISTILFIIAIALVIWKNHMPVELAKVLSQVFIPLGIAFTVITLISGYFAYNPKLLL